MNLIFIRNFSALRFDRNELAGAFGDIGTDLPLLIGVILAAKLDAASVLIVFGSMQILTALFYHMPMPVQPLKAMAALVIAQKIDGEVLFGAGLAIGIAMFLLSISGALVWLSRAIPKAVVRGIQFGLGLQLALLALKDYVPSEGMLGYALAAVGFLIALFLLGNRKYPASLFVIALGMGYALVLHSDTVFQSGLIGISLPKFFIPTWEMIASGFLLLALPQIPLSISNSILATKQTASDLFPEKSLSVQQLGLTYAAMNLMSAFVSGVPICHGSGGLVGHYAFGGRTGGSVVIYGLLYLVLGLFFASGFEHIIKLFPLPILGVILFFEGLSLITLLRDLLGERKDFFVAILTGVLAAGLPCGYVLGAIVGTLVWYFKQEN
ncbi:MAG: putative sulfate/molybdate transporter [Chloroherpetonaceae bacterium]